MHYYGQGRMCRFGYSVVKVKDGIILGLFPTLWSSDMDIIC